MANAMDVVSIIIPVFNMYDKLYKCLNSVINQTYKNIEIIVVNDGSIDYTFDDYLKFQELDYRVKVYNQSNGGVSKARNRGLDEAKGNYIMFIDSDDWIESDYVEKMVRASLNSDIVISSFSDEYINNAVKRNYKKNINKNLVDKFDISEFIDDCLNGQVYTFVIWAKLYKKEILKEQRFSNQAYSEDTIFIRRVMLNCNSVNYLDYEGYHYVIGEGVTCDISRVIETTVNNAMMLDIFYNDYYKLVSESQRKNVLKKIKGSLESSIKVHIKKRKKINEKIYTIYRKYAKSFTIADLIHLKLLFLLSFIICH